jgi:hypothetical protein
VKRKRSSRRRPLLWFLTAASIEAAAMKLRGYPIGGNIVVRCRRGHLYTTLWIPGASVKSIRLGWWRIQHCPVGRHWTLVTPVKPAELTDEEESLARTRHDLRLP